MHFLPIFILSLLAIQIQTIGAYNCLQTERDALLEFKAGVNDPFHRLASWRGDNCCTWAGIKCSNQSGQVVKLNLVNPSLDWRTNSLSSEISPSLHALTDLKYLDLSYNNFSGYRFPEFICSFRKLKHLDLSGMGLSGMIPSQISNLSRLQYLSLNNLEWSYFNPSIPSQFWWPDNYVADIWWFSHLSSLKFLDISGVNLQDSGEWVQALNMLPLLETLYLDGNNLTTIPTSLPIVNFTYLTTFYIGDIYFSTPMPAWIGQLTSLTELIFWNCSFTSPIPNLFGNLSSLTKLSIVSNNYLEGPISSLHNLQNLKFLHLESININEDINEFVSKFSNDTLEKFDALVLGSNNLTGNLTGWLDKMPNLSILALIDNKLNGTIPAEIGNLSKLNSLLLKCSFVGEISEVHLSGLTNLESLELVSSSMSIRVASNWVPLFQLEYLQINDCDMGPKFPSWLQNQTQLINLVLSNTGIIDSLPNWFWNISSLFYLDMSYNQIRGRLPPSLGHYTQLQTLVLKHNQFTGPIFSSLPPSLSELDLSYNSLSGPLPLKFKGSTLSILILSNNLFNSSIGNSICGLISLQILSLSGNNISGDLPHCWPKLLQVMDLANNKLSGTIPHSMSPLNRLVVLQLNNNSLTGELPSGLQLCRDLSVLDFGQNQFYGQLPEWIGGNLSNLLELRLRSNSFVGSIPSNIMNLSKLHVLDLSDNNLAGSIPQNLDNLLAMASINPNSMSNSSLIDFLTEDLSFYNVSLSVVMKGLDLEYSTIPLSSLKSIDLSDNNLTGEIPQNITTLFGLTNLNLSNNHLSGTIPTEIGNMRSMESLDLHMNNLMDIIPYSLATLNFLTTLNLSYNNLSGEIPTGDQLQTLIDPYSYIGNAYLCGPPLNKSCNTGTTVHIYNSTSNQELEEVLLYLFVVLGFAFGFSVFFGVLMFKRNWRYHYFHMVDNMFDRIYVFVMLYFARLRGDAAK